MEACKEFFKTIYSFIYLLGTYLKPHVSTSFSSLNDRLFKCGIHMSMLLLVKNNLARSLLWELLA